MLGIFVKLRLRSFGLNQYYDFTKLYSSITIGSRRVVYSLSIQTWGGGDFGLVQHEACAEIKDLKCRDIKLFDGNCASLELGKDFKPIEVPDN